MHSILAEMQFWPSHDSVMQADTMLVIQYCDILLGHLFVLKYVILCSFDRAL
jgi:hypothetical protein